MEEKKQELRQTVIRQNYNPLAATIRAGYELECVLEHLQKDEFKPDDIREISSSFNNVIETANKIMRVLTVKNKQL